MLSVVGLIFILINYGLSRLAVWTEKRLSRASKGKVVGGADAMAIESGMGTAAGA
jgi:hypothetical protein